MNGTTTIDAILNPCSAECDRRTYGWQWLNVSTYGKRLIRLHVGRLTLDVYRGLGKVFTAMGGGANGTARYWNLFTPIGSVTWVTRKANKPAHAEVPERQRRTDSMKPMVRCLYCEEELKPAPTIRGWVKKDHRSGVCFPCIANLHRTMVAHQKMEAIEDENERTSNDRNEAQ